MLKHYSAPTRDQYKQVAETLVTQYPHSKDPGVADKPWVGGI